jgi:protein CMS1
MSDSESFHNFEGRNAFKRKRELEGELEHKSTPARKRRKSKKPKDIDDEDLDLENGINRIIGRMDPSLLGDLVAQRTRRFNRELSVVELEDLLISGS